ncbi:MAG: hypothetical protein ABJC74_03410 [Gemmatimonadota bacterium]
MAESVRPLAVGIVHGLAGSAAVALLVLTTIREQVWAVYYLLVFGVGTTVGMMVITAVIALPLSAAGAASPRWNAGIRVEPGILCLVLGLPIAYQIGMVHGLFATSPGWTPR